MFWIILGALVLLYCIVVNMKLGKVRFSLVPALGGAALILLGVCILAFPEQMIVWFMQFAATALLLVLAGVECTVLAGSRKDDGGAKMQPDYTIVLGCGLKKGNRMTSTLLERLELAKKLYKGEKLVLSGGQTPRETVSEASVMTKWMMENGVPAELLRAEDSSLNTKQNLENCKALLEAETGTEIGNLSVRIITSDFHAGRARKLAEECGYGEVPVCGSKTMPLIAPMYHLRECLAVIYGGLRKKGN